MSTIRPSARIFVIGAAHEDLTLYVADLPRSGETALSHDRRTGCGGKGANQAVAAAAAGAPTCFVGALGADDRGQRVRRSLELARVDTSRSSSSSSVATGVAVVVVDGSGSNQIVVDVGASGTLETAQIDEALSDCRPLDLVVTQCELPGPLVEHTITSAARLGARVVVNLAPFAPLDTSVLKMAWLVVANEHEAAAAVGREPDADGGPGRVEADREAAAACAALWDAACVVTRGSRGSLAATPDGSMHEVAAAPAREVVDTTGAGDVYVGTLAAALVGAGACYGQLPEAMHLASVAAAASVQRHGAQTPDHPPAVGSSA